MKKTLSIKTGSYTRAGVNAFPGVYTEIVQAILDNPTVFTGLPVPVPQLETSMGMLVDKTNIAKRGSEHDKTERDIQMELCLSYLAQLGAYVLQVASLKPTLEEQIAVVQLSKFVLSKITSEPTPPLPQVEGVRGEWSGVEGEAMVQWEKIAAGAVSYNIYKTLTDPTQPNVQWQFVRSTTRKQALIGGLPSLARVWVRVVAVGKDDEISAPSDPAMITMG